MKKRHLLCSVIVLVISIGGLAFYPPSRSVLLGYLNNEPRHEGRPTRYWIHTVKEGDPAQRQHAAHVLGKIEPGSAGVVQALIIALRDDDYIVRKNAALALGEIGLEAEA